MHDASSSTAPYLNGPAAFIRYYVRQRAATFLVLLVLVTCAAGAAVGVQYVMKLLVDGMTTSGGDKSAIWSPLGLFLALIACESLTWRAVGWLT